MSQPLQFGLDVADVKIARHRWGVALHFKVTVEPNPGVLPFRKPRLTGLLSESRQHWVISCQ
jgi:hypothetical protein